MESITNHNNNNATFGSLLLNNFSIKSIEVDDFDEEFSQLISDRTIFYFNLYVHFLLCGSMATFGSINNIINMIIFHRIGMNDSMSIGLMALSLTDFLVSFLSVLRMSFFVWDEMEPDSKIDPLGVNHVTIGWWRDLLFLCSAWVTTFLSIERCVCVVFPFKVKVIFTKTRSVMAMVAIYVIHIAAHMPIFTSQWLGWTTVEVDSDNGTVLIKDRLVAKFSSERKSIQFYIDIANGAVLPIPSQILVLISVVWMISGLHVTSKIRVNPNLMANATSDQGETKRQSNLSYKERRLVKVVLFLAIILTLCNVPRFIAVYAKQLFPQVSFRNTHGNLYMLLWNIALVSSIVNSCCNIFVYLIVNSTYRQNFKEMFGINTRKQVDE